MYSHRAVVRGVAAVVAAAAVVVVAGGEGGSFYGVLSSDSLHN